MNGFGIYKMSYKRTYEGFWKEGEMNGSGKFMWEDGRIYEGKFLV